MSDSPAKPETLVSSTPTTRSENKADGMFDCRRPHQLMMYCKRHEDCEQAMDTMKAQILELQVKIRRIEDGEQHCFFGSYG